MNNLICGVYREGKASIWNISGSTEQPLFIFDTEGVGINCIEEILMNISNNKIHCLLMACNDNSIKLYKIEKEGFIKSFDGHASRVRFLQLIDYSDFSIVASASAWIH